MFRISGFGLLTGSLVFILHIALRSVITAGSDPVTIAKQSLWVPINMLGVLGAILVFLGLPAMYARMAVFFGLPGLIGVVLLAVAWTVIGLFISLYSLLIVPWLVDSAPSLIVALPVAFVIAFMVGLVAWLSGSILLAVPFLRKRAQPTWVGYALLASAVWMVIGNLILAPSSPASNLAINLLSNLGPVLLLIGIAQLGYCMSLEQASTVVRDNRLRNQ
jgi:hypothetical protein